MEGVSQPNNGEVMKNKRKSKTPQAIKANKYGNILTVNAKGIPIAAFEELSEAQRFARAFMKDSGIKAFVCACAVKPNLKYAEGWEPT